MFLKNELLRKHLPPIWENDAQDWESRRGEIAEILQRELFGFRAVGDIWSDPNTEYLSACAAGDMYERLGRVGLVHPDRYPVPGDIFHEGLVGYHMREGLHDLSPEDWKRYMEFIRKTQV